MRRISLTIAMEHLLFEDSSLTYLQFRDLVRLAAADPVMYAGGCSWNPARDPMR